MKYVLTHPLVITSSIKLSTYVIFRYIFACKIFKIMFLKNRKKYQLGKFIFIIIVKLKSSSNSTISNIMTRISTSTPSLLPDVPNDNINMDQTASLDPLPLAAKV